MAKSFVLIKRDLMFLKNGKMDCVDLGCVEVRFNSVKNKFSIKYYENGIFKNKNMDDETELAKQIRKMLEQNEHISRLEITKARKNMYNPFYHLIKRFGS